MARGWESKSVESQKEDRDPVKKEKKKIVSPDMAQRIQKLESLDLSRRRIVRELEEATSPVRKASLQHALRFLDEEIARLQK